ncbi:response regulator [Paenibacillus sp. LjRoot153]|uniref:response regulator n=1 Tax=Paenibacillus sp. LjRoot153 TaxID=3342270 RepID=UPI003ED04BC3
MYTILLVDDEKLELETLEGYTPWREMGIKVAGTANNGKEALAKLKELKPDIVLTDVRMPIMDGLEFAKRAKQIDKYVKIVFLSGHNEFQYIKSALTMEAVGYLLKPMDLEELTELMNRVKKKCEEDRLASQSQESMCEKLVLRLIREKDEEQRQDWIRKLVLLQSGFPLYGDYVIAVFSIDPPFENSVKRDAFPAGTDLLPLLHSVLQEQPGHYIALDTEPGCIAVLAHADPLRVQPVLERSFWQQIRQNLNRYTDGIVTVGLSSPERGLERLPYAYDSAKQANECKFYSHMGSVIMPEDSCDTATLEVDVEPYAEELIRSIKQWNASQTEAIADSFFAKLRETHIRRNQAIYAVIRMMAAIEQQFSMLLGGSNNNLLYTDHWKEVSSMASLMHIQKYVVHYCSRIAALLKERSKDRNLLLVEHIVQIMEDRYHLPITVDDMAKEVYLSPNYIRTLFKEKKGETILDCLTKIRIQHATEMLKDKSLKIHEIAHAVGYENVSYFCSVFQKHKGSTPNEYRKMVP